MFKRWQNLSEILPDYLEEFLTSYNDKREGILDEVEQFARENKIPILLPSAAAFLRFLVSLIRPEKVLEIGTGIGYSALSIYYACPGVEIITVDSNKKRASVAREFFRKAKAKITLVEADAFDVLEDFLCEGMTFDLIFVDSVKSEYPFFNCRVQALLAERGVAIFDNVLFRGYIAGREFDKKYGRRVDLLRLFLSQVREYPGFEAVILPVGDGLLLLKRKTVV